MAGNLRVPPGGGSPRDVAFLLTQLLAGKINAVGTLTISSSVTNTVIYNPLVSGVSTILLTPLTSGAASEPVYVESQAAGASFTLAHSVGTSARVYSYAILG